MFRERQKFYLEPTGHVYQDELIENKNGEYVMTSTDLSTLVLPDAENFDLKNMLDAGVDMEEVNSKVLSQKIVNADNVVRKYTKKTENEVNE